MNEREKTKIGYELFKMILVERFRLKNIRDIKEKIENYSKETGISKNRLLIFGKIALRETMEEEFIKLNKETKVGFQSNKNP